MPHKHFYWQRREHAIARTMSDRIFMLLCSFGLVHPNHSLRFIFGQRDVRMCVCFSFFSVFVFHSNRSHITWSIKINAHRRLWSLLCVASRLLTWLSISSDWWWRASTQSKIDIFWAIVAAAKLIHFYFCCAPFVARCLHSIIARWVNRPQRAHTPKVSADFHSHPNYVSILVQVDAAAIRKWKHLEQCPSLLFNCHASCAPVGCATRKMDAMRNGKCIQTQWNCASQKSKTLR